MSSSYQQAIDAGLSEDEIIDYFESKKPGFKKSYQEARAADMSPEEIFEYFGSKTQKTKQPQESTSRNINRQFVRTGLRGAETALGAPRAFGDFLESLVPEKLITAGAEKIGLKEPVERGFKFVKEHAPHKLFPKSEDIRREVSDRFFGEASKPKNEWEAKADEAVSDFTALALPLPGGKIKPLKAGLLALGGNAGSEVVGRMGGSDQQKAYVKLGIIFAGSFINPKAAENLKNDLYSKAREARPADAEVSSKSITKAADKLEKSLLEGDPKAPSKTKSRELVSTIKDKAKSGEISLDELEEFKRNINEARAGLYDEFKSNKVGRKTAKRNLDSVSKLIDGALNEYGKQNPQWEAFYRPANEVHGAIAQSNRARNWITRNALKFGATSLLAELGLYVGVGPAAAAGGAAIGAATIGAEAIAQRFARSPTLRKHYIQLLNGAMKEDVVVVRENLKKIEKELQESDQSKQLK
jgi:hypothetical protein